MSRGRQYIQFEGYFAEGLLGIFRIIRGFADLRGKSKGSNAKPKDPR